MTDPVLAGVVLDSDVAVPRRDGTVLRADIYRPYGSGRLPALLMRLPYDKRRAQSYWYAAPAWYAERGYAVVVEDVRGRHRSDGRFVPLVHEAQDGVDLITWVAGQAWCDGSVGMFGYSYCGLLQLHTASRAGDLPLRGIAPALSPPGLGEGCLFQGSVPAAAFLLGWAAELGGLRLGAASGRPAVTRDAMRSLVLEPFEAFGADVADHARDWMAHWLACDPEDSYWQRSSALTSAGITAQALHLAGWYDTFRAGSIGHYERMRTEPRRPPSADRLVIGPWTHQPVRDARSQLATPDNRNWQIDDLQLAFFDEVMQGSPAGAGPPVRVAVLNSADTWTGAQWPPPHVPTQWYLASGGRANGLDGDGALLPEVPRPCAPDHLIYDHADPVVAAGGDDCGDPDVVAMGAADQEAVERRRDVLVYTSHAMEDETVLAGHADVLLHVHAAEPRSQWLARLCLVTATGISINVAEAVVRTAMTAGEPTEVHLDLGPVAFRLGRGERVRLHVTQGSTPRWAGLRDSSGHLVVSRSAVLHDPDHPSRLCLPHAA